MGKVRRVYVEKKPEFTVSAKSLYSEIGNYLGIKNVTGVRVLIRYDIQDVSDDVFKKAVKTVFSEPPVDNVFEDSFEYSGRIFSVEYLPGQFDQRADSAEQCLKLLNENEEPTIHTATTYVIEGNISDDEFNAIKMHCINPVDSRETSEVLPESLSNNFDEPADVKIFDGFISLAENDLRTLYDS